MKRKGLYLALYGIMSLAMITGCKGEESHKTVEKDTSKQTEAQDNSESKDDDKESVKENIVVIQDKDIYDGINRIAISICGNPVLLWKELRDFPISSFTISFIFLLI